MNNTIKNVLESLSVIFAQVDTVLLDWKGAGCLQIPTLLSMMATKLNWTDKQSREYDPFVRYYIRNHPDWYVTRGAKGGIMKTSDQQKRLDNLEAKRLAKLQVQADINAKLNLGLKLSSELISEVTSEEPSSQTILSEEDSLESKEEISDDDFEGLSSF